MSIKKLESNQKTLREKKTDDLKEMKIENFNKKLNGEIPVTREELLKLVSSWGRTSSLRTIDSNGNDIRTFKSEPTKKYNLSKLDVSQITNFDDIFAFSSFNGDISKWNTSNATSMRKMFYHAKDFNQPLNFNTINVTNMDRMLHGASKFNQPLNFNTPNLKSAEGMLANTYSFEQPINFDVSNLSSCDSMLYSSAFIKKFNNNENIENPKEWLEQNRSRINELTITTKLESNQKTFDDLIKEKNIKVDSPMYNSLLELYNETQEKLKSDIEELRREVIEIATNNLEL